MCYRVKRVLKSAILLYLDDWTENDRHSCHLRNEFLTDNPLNTRDRFLKALEDLRPAFDQFKRTTACVTLKKLLIEHDSVFTNR